MVFSRNSRAGRRCGRARRDRGWLGPPLIGRLVESLEDRCLLSHNPISGFGAVGDSLTDEYEFEDYNYAANWLEILVLERGLDFGATGTWGEPRRNAYEHNWARSGATSQSLLAAGQHTGLAAQVNAGDVSHAALAVGPNDFFSSSQVSPGIDRWVGEDERWSCRPPPLSGHPPFYCSPGRERLRSADAPPAA